MKKGADISEACEKSNIWNTDLYRMRKKGLINFAGAGKSPIKRKYTKRIEPTILVDAEENLYTVFFFRGSAHDLENLTKLGATHANN